MKVYVDLDQVLVNFLAGARKALGKEFNDPSLGTDPEKFRHLSDTCINFWLNLEWMPGAESLWNQLRQYNPFILSATPPADIYPSCPAEKIQWCIDNLGITKDRVFIVSRKEKREFSNPDSLLIDDHPTNVREWRENGGTAILHHTVTETLNEITQLGLWDLLSLPSSYRASE